MDGSADQIDCAKPRLPIGGHTRSRARAAFGKAPESAMALRWAALHDAAAAVAVLAGARAEPMRQATRDFPAILNELGGWRRNLAEQGVSDLAAVMEPGLAALLSIQARGADPASAALALWTEFRSACDQLLMLVPEDNG